MDTTENRYRPTEVCPIPVDTLQPLKEAGLDMSYYLNQLAAGAQIKVPLAMAAGFYAQYLGGDWVLLAAWFLLDLLDLFFGSWNAIRKRTFSMLRFRKWVIKVLTYGITILVFAVLNMGFNRASGFNAPILDGFLMVLLATEAMSIFNNMRKLGWPVPAVAAKLAQRIHDKANEQLDEITQIERADNYDEPDHQD